MLHEAFNTLHLMHHEATACHVTDDIVMLLTIMQQTLATARKYIAEKKGSCPMLSNILIIKWTSNEPQMFNSSITMSQRSKHGAVQNKCFVLKLVTNSIVSRPVLCLSLFYLLLSTCRMISFYTAVEVKPHLSAWKDRYEFVRKLLTLLNSYTSFDIRQATFGAYYCNCYVTLGLDYKRASCSS